MSSRRALSAGDPVLLRSVYAGRVRWCFPHRYVGEWNGRHGIYCQPGTAGKVIKPPGGGDYLPEWAASTPPRDHVWEATHVLRFMAPGARHTIEIYWDLAWELMGWYVNLQSPLVVCDVMFDAIDWALDVTVEPDGTWAWKDEDDLARAIALGLISEAAAADVRAEGERVIAAAPWPTGWESWRPPADWRPLTLPADWDRPGAPSD